MDGTDSDEESDLDIVRTSAKEVDLPEVLDDQPETQSSDKEVGPPAKRRRRDHTPEGDRVGFSEDDEGGKDVYQKFKHRRTDQRKKAAARTRKARAAANESSIVGRKPKTLNKPEDRRPAKLVKGDTYGTDSDDEAPETALPQFLKERRSAWELRREKLGEAGLSLPPDYEEVDFSDNEHLESLPEKPVFTGIQPPKQYQDVELSYSAGIIPAPIAQWLRDYQVKGAEFLHEMFVWQKGGLLGDDMGLGKTIQVIAFLTAAFGKTGDSRDKKRMRKMRRAQQWYPKVLIVCPGGLMDNWQQELRRWGWWHVDKYHGPAAVREASLNAAKSGRLEIMITTYTTYRMNKGDINLVEWDCVIADECHQVKERNSEVTKAMNEVNALCRIGLSGTVVQNKYDELWTLLNWTNPGKFGPLSAWKASISDPLKLGQSHDATVAQLAKARKTAEKLVKNLLPNFFLRRLKTLIADQLPRKSDRVVFCPLTDEQAEAYENLVDSELVDYIRRSADLCDCDSGKKRGWCCYKSIPGHGPWQANVFPTIMVLQRLSNHLAMLIPSSSDPKDKQEQAAEILQIALPDKWQDLYRTRDSIVNYANQSFCGKWRVLKKLLRFWHQNGDKVLVFSHSVRLLKMLAILFKSATSYNVSYLDGSMKYEDRSKVVEEFNTESTQFVFLISTKAGGVGLNITSANKVVIFDPNWNPSWDLQAQDRAYRIGQTRDVEVFRLVSAGTVEEIVYARQIYKQQQANIAYTASLERRYFKGVQDQKEKKGEIFGLVNLFSYQGDNVVLRDIVNKTNIAESKAGVSVVGLDSTQDYANDDDDDDDYPNGLASSLRDENSVHAGEDAVMSQLAAVIAEGDLSTPSKTKETLQKKKKKTTTTPDRNIDAVQAILAGAGVEYTHENSEVIGSSKMETKLSKRAERTGNDIDLSNKSVFEKSSSQLLEPHLPRRDPLGPLPVPAAQDQPSPGGNDSSAVKWQWQPPEQVRKRQFCSMAAWAGYHGQDGVQEFALLVEGSWTQAQRRHFLDRFYRWRRREVLGLAV
ncbi:hypothetical protein AAFC00_006175 [Neodothiora populina]|uniref:DNA excision repair protein n=1 Tax=Neodothiora populina TaxID=2781224 RepID=A0ABR3P493_9PEZI